MYLTKENKMERKNIKEITITLTAKELKELVLQHVTKAYPEFLGTELEIYVNNVCLTDSVCVTYKDFVKISSKMAEVIL